METSTELHVFSVLSRGGTNFASSIPQICCVEIVETEGSRIPEPNNDLQSSTSILELPSVRGLVKGLDILAYLRGTNALRLTYPFKVSAKTCPLLSA